MPGFFQKNPGVVVTVTLWLCTTLFGLGYVNHQFTALSEKVDGFDRSDMPAARETRWKVAEIEKRLDKAELEAARNRDLLADMRSDVKVIAAYVKSQQDRESRAGK